MKARLDMEFLEVVHFGYIGIVNVKKKKKNRHFT